MRPLTGYKQGLQDLGKEGAPLVWDMPGRSSWRGWPGGWRGSDRGQWRLGISGAKSEHMSVNVRNDAKKQ